MKKLFFLALSGLFFLNLSAQDENETWHCMTDQIYNEIIRNNPEILKLRQEIDEFVKDYIKNNPKDDQVYVIPVVFHVVHMYGDENISYQQIVDAVDFMNRDFALRRSDTSQIIADFKPIAADVKIEFRLARKDPNGNCTIGVTRTVSETTNGGGEAAKYAAPAWPTNKYLNIWVVKSLGGGAAGWSYYPGTAPQGADGIILLHDYVGPTGTGSTYKASTLTHEAGHYLNLPHPWGSTNEPGLQSNCDIDDGIEDTPNTIGHTSCSVWAITCGSLDNVQNFMEYSYCGKMFTQGQANAMRAILNTPVAGRNNLWSASNRIATGTNDNYVPAICAPIADFKANKKIGCTGFKVQYNDLTHNTDYIETYNWTLPGTEYINYSEANPLVTYIQSGKFSAQLYVENPTDSDIKFFDNYIQVYDKNDGYQIPYTEGFETQNFPTITNNPGNDFIVIPSGNKTWEQTNYGISGKAIRIQNRYNDYGTKNRIYLPNLIIDNDTTPVTVSFKAAYARPSTTQSDKLKFYVSSACGDSLRIVWLVSGTALTSTYVNENENYIPSENDWKTHTFKINPIALRGNNLRLVIESECGNGNTIYIDDVTFYQEIASNSIEQKIANDISIYPNPAKNELFVETEHNGNYTLSIMDVSGKLLQTAEFNGISYDASHLIENLSSGLYFINLSFEGKTLNYKLFKE